MIHIQLQETEYSVAYSFLIFLIRMYAQCIGQFDNIAIFIFKSQEMGPNGMLHPSSHLSQ